MRKIFPILLLCFLSCQSVHKNSEPEQVINEQDYLHLVGQSVLSLDSVIDSEEKQEEIVLLYHPFDCGTCIDSGYVYTKMIAESKKKKTRIITIMNNPAMEQKRNKYFEYIYIDRSDRIRKELKYVQTPIFLLIDSTRIIKDYFLPNNSEPYEIERFMSKL